MKSVEITRSVSCGVCVYAIITQSELPYIACSNKAIDTDEKRNLVIGDVCLLHVRKECGAEVPIEQGECGMQKVMYKCFKRIGEHTVDCVVDIESDTATFEVVKAEADKQWEKVLAELSRRRLVEGCERDGKLKQRKRYDKELVLEACADCPDHRKSCCAHEVGVRPYILIRTGEKFPGFCTLSEGND